MSASGPQTSIPTQQRKYKRPTFPTQPQPHAPLKPLCSCRSGCCLDYSLPTVVLSWRRQHTLHLLSNAPLRDVRRTLFKVRSGKWSWRRGGPYCPAERQSSSHSSVLLPMFREYLLHCHTLNITHHLGNDGAHLTRKAQRCPPTQHCHTSIGRQDYG